MKKFMCSLVFLFIAIAITGCKLSGTITKDGEPLEGVTVVLSGDASMSTTTSATGEYSFDVSNKSRGYTISPQSDCYTFNPEAIVVQVNKNTRNDDFSNFNFSGQGTIYSGHYIIRDINDLNNLSGYTKIIGNLNIQNTDLTNFDGLECLTEVAGLVYITNNPNLNNIDGLSNLTSIGGLVIRNQPDITTVDFLLLETNTGSFEITRTGLSDLTGFASLNYIGSFVNIWDNDSMVNVAGLKNLITIDGGLSIWDNDSLSDLSGLHGLNSIGGDYSVTSNTELCENLAVDLKDLIMSRGGIGGGIDISNNKQCPRMSVISFNKKLG